MVFSIYPLKASCYSLFSPSVKRCQWQQATLFEQFLKSWEAQRCVWRFYLIISEVQLWSGCGDDEHLMKLAVRTIEIIWGAKKQSLFPSSGNQRLNWKYSLIKTTILYLSHYAHPSADSVRGVTLEGHVWRNSILSHVCSWPFASQGITCPTDKWGFDSQSLLQTTAATAKQGAVTCCVSSRKCWETTHIRIIWSGQSLPLRIIWGNQACG